MKNRIVFAQEDQSKLNKFVRPFLHDHIAGGQQRPMFIADYHAPLDQVYQENGYTVVKKSIKQCWMQCDTDPFVYLITPQPNIFKLYTEQPDMIEKFFQQLDPLLIDAFNDGKCAILIHNVKEQYAGNHAIEQKLHNLLRSIGIRHPEKIIMLENAPDGDFSDFFTFVQWNYAETTVRRMNFDIDVNQKFQSSYKKFLCLNYTPRYHRREFMYRMRDAGLLHDFNASHYDAELPLNYDVDDHNSATDLKPSSGHIPMLIKDVNHWNTVPTMLSTDNLIFVVTDTPFQTNEPLFTTEKTWKPMLLKMPFILLSNAGTLQYLKSLGYKTFDHMWSEDYDDIQDQHNRMTAVCDLVKKLSSMHTDNLKKLVQQNYHILEHNYKLLMQRRPEQSVFDAVEKIISRQ